MNLSANVSNINYEHYGNDEDDDGDEDKVPHVEQMSFFAKGRDYESTNVNHRFTEAEKAVMSEFDSLDFLPPDSKVYKTWVKSQPSRWDWDRWVVMGLIGACVGLLGFLMHQIIDVIAETKWDYANELIVESFFLGWLWIFGFSLLFLLPSTLIVVYLRPSAAGSGLPELIGFLNGTLIRHIFNIKTLAVKFLSCAMAVGSGMPVGPEGPMIHIGALIGAGISQFESKTFGVSLPIFQRFRNSQDRRNFISAGAAAGIASAFGAPVGGLLFAMEEVSSYWSLSLAWQIFFCCMVSSFTTDLLSSSFSGFKYTGPFGQFKTDRYILFNVASGIDMNILALIPSVLLGIIGGVLGSLFTFINLKLVRLRKKILAGTKSPGISNLLKISEPVFILFLMSTMSVLIPEMLPCTPLSCTVPTNTLDSHSHCTNQTNGQTIEASVVYFTCPNDKFHMDNGSTLLNGSFSQAASLYFGTGEGAIHHLFSRNTHLQFDYLPLISMMVFYFVMACWAAGTYISSGMVVPMILIGALYGRMTGRLMVDVIGQNPGEFWNFVDPGAMALIGACSFFGGVTRLTMSLTVIMVEMTNDIQFLLLIMTTVMTAKWVGDYITHPFYHALLELKCIPFLDSDPVVLSPNGEKLNLELFRADHVMKHPVVTVTARETVTRLAEIVMSTKHGGFPVVDLEKRTFQGLITRSELVLFLLDFNANSSSKNIVDNTYKPRLSFPQISAHMNRKLKEPPGVNETIQKLSERRDGIQLNLSDYINTSSVSIPANFSLQRTYIIFRSLGLRHMTVVDLNNCVQGIITRKDLMGFALEDKLLPMSSEVLQSFEQEQPLQEVSS